MILSKIGEFGFIDRVRKRQKEYDKSVIIGIGDDAALIRPSIGQSILITTDLLLENIHFDLSFTTFFQLGYKAIAVNISDIAAMGGFPRYILISLGVPQNLSVNNIDDLYNGISRLAERYNINIIGGDTSRSQKGIFISLTLIGEIEESLVIKRNGASVGDKIFVTGTIGDSSAGLEILQKRFEGFDLLINRHHFPSPRLSEGRLLAIQGLASSMIDISDGLSSDLSHICAESKKGALINREDIPISEELSEFATTSGNDPILYALNGGEDYELLFTVKMDKIRNLMQYIRENGLDITCIGEILPYEEGINITDNNKNIKPLNTKGFDHFKEY